MRSLTRTGTALLTAALLVGCASESGPTESTLGLAASAADHNTVEHAVYTIAITELDLNPCNGEQVQLAGTLVGQLHLVGPEDALANGDKLHERVHEVVSETGTGLTTGASYTLHATYSEGFNTPNFPAPNATFTELQKIRVTSSTPGLTYTAVAAFHLIGLPSGEIKVTREQPDQNVCEKPLG